MPSLSPDSTFRPCRMREGSRGSVTTACPSAASVGARITARISTSARLNEPNSPAPTAQPAAIVSGSPIPSSRRGSRYSRRSARTSIREASANSTSVRVTSARLRTCSLDGPMSIHPSPLLPTSSPAERKKIGAEIQVRGQQRARRPRRGGGLRQQLRGPRCSERDLTGVAVRSGRRRSTAQRGLDPLEPAVDVPQLVRRNGSVLGGRLLEP